MIYAADLDEMQNEKFKSQTILNRYNFNLSPGTEVSYASEPNKLNAITKYLHYNT